MTYIFSEKSGGFELRIGKMPDFDCELWWRADDLRYANYDQFAEFEQPSGSHLVILLTPLAVEKHTPKGVWLRRYMGERFFVLGNAIRQRAVPTQELAIADLIKRKERHVKGCEQRLNLAKKHLAAAEATQGRF